MIIRIGSNSEILAGSRCFPLYPRKRTSGMRAAMSELCHFRTHAPHKVYCGGTPCVSVRLSEPRSGRG